MTAARAQALFREAVADLAAEPNPGNVKRYLAASHVLDRCVAAELPQTDSRSNRAPKSKDTAPYTPALERA
jgi:hypothetical protein